MLYGNKFTEQLKSIYFFWNKPSLLHIFPSSTSIYFFVTSISASWVTVNPNNHIQFRKFILTFRIFYVSMANTFKCVLTQHTRVNKLLLTIASRYFVRWHWWHSFINPNGGVVIVPTLFSEGYFFMKKGVGGRYFS